MAFPFKKIDMKETFKSTFLNEASMKCVFEDGKAAFPSFEEAKVFFKSFFNLELQVEQFDRLINTKLKVMSAAQGITFELSRKSIKISFLQSHYHNFELSLFPIIKKLFNSDCKLTDRLSKLEMKFVDVWPVANKSDVNDSILKALEEVVFSSELRQQHFENDDNFKVLHFEDGRFRLIIKYGSYYPVDKEMTSGIALETKCIFSNLQALPEDEKLDVSKDMNDVLYDCFIWSVSNQVIDAMRKSYSEPLN